MKKILMAAFAAAIATGADAQVFKKDLPGGDPYPGYNRNMQVDPSLGVRRKLTGPRRAAATQPPTHWNNADQPYFPPIFSQGGYGSCGVSSHVGYMMTSEMNAYQNTDASKPENQLTPMFEYPFTYHGPGKDEMALYVGFPTADIYGGRYESSIYGGSESDRGDWGWVQGYDIFYNAMKHRITHAARFPQDVGTEEGRAAVKRYLYNHNDDPRFGGRGGIVCVGVGISKSNRTNIPQTATNDENGFTGKVYMEHWTVGGVDHAVTICGYDDRVQFDLDKNGVAGETKNSLGQNENGAWIIANSWGQWANKGFVYCPYALGAARSFEVTTDGGQKAYTADGYWMPYVYYYRCGYTPKRTLKVKMQYSHRSEISVLGGIASDTTATKPEKTFQFEYINYTGDGTGKDPATPMLGTWADGKVHTEPMEFGIDLTDLSDEFDIHKPLKYFLVVNSKNTSKGEGKVLETSVIDYEMNPEGVETPILSAPVDVKTQGKQTLVSGVVNGEPLNAPLNAEMQGTTLKWLAPQGTAYTPAKYYVYKDGEKVGESTTTSYTVPATDGTWTVCAVYTISGSEVLSSPSNAVTAAGSLTADQAYDTDAISASNGSFYVPDVVATAHNAYTVEFWFKPSNLHNWGDFFFYNNWGSKYRAHTAANGSISAGWATGSGDRIDTPAGVLKNGTWAHIAFVVDGNKHYIYVNGVQRASGTSATHSGFTDYWSGRLYFGDKNTLNGQMDELRLWSCARTADQIKNSYQVPIVSPEKEDNLEAYFKGDTYAKDGKTYIKDWAHGHDAVVEQNITKQTLTGEPTIKKGAGTAQAAIVAPAQANIGEPVKVKAVASVGTTGYSWTAEGGTPAVSDIASPSFVFNTPGDHKVSVSVTDISGNTATAEAVVNVVSITPTADFTLSVSDVKAKGRISFISANKAPGCKYSWSMPQADKETATTTNASATYSTLGTKTVTLTVTAPDGKTYTSSKTFDVTLIAPIAAVDITPGVVLKGETVNVSDRSEYDPESGEWIFLSSNSYIPLEGLKGTVTPTKAGVYDLTYTAVNSQGSNTITVPRALIVCNEDSKTGLNFYKGGDQTLTFSVPSSVNTAWTLDFWMNPDQLTDKCVGIKAAGTGKSLALTSDADGKLTLSIDGQAKETLPNNFYVAGQWHHYAFVATSKKLACYRDGEKMGELATDLSSYTDYLKTVTIGGSDAPFKGNIDELRLWGKSIASTLKNYVARSLTDAQTLKTSQKLYVYYDFNQDVVTGATVIDRTGNGATGTLSGFENTVDYFTPSKGVFGLSFEKAANETLKGSKLESSAFTVESTSDEEDGSKQPAPGSNVLDGSMSTFWHSKWSDKAAGFPHAITFHRNTNDSIQSVVVAYATDNDHNSDRYRANSITVEQSFDNANWQTVDKNHVLFSFSKQNVAFLHPVTAPYLRLTFNGSLANSNFLCISEINFYGNPIDPTGISTVKVDTKSDNAIYDLQGRRLSNMKRPGIYIVGGKKVVVK